MKTLSAGSVIARDVLGPFSVTRYNQLAGSLVSVNCPVGSRRQRSTRPPRTSITCSELSPSRQSCTTNAVQYDSSVTF